MKPGKLIKTYREKLGMTQLELANKLGYSIPQFISLLENGHSSLPLSITNNVIKTLNIPENVMIEALKEEYLELVNTTLKPKRVAK